MRGGSETAYVTSRSVRTRQTNRARVAVYPGPSRRGPRADGGRARSAPGGGTAGSSCSSQRQSRSRGGRPPGWAGGAVSLMACKCTVTWGGSWGASRYQRTGCTPPRPTRPRPRAQRTPPRGRRAATWLCALEGKLYTSGHLRLTSCRAHHSSSVLSGRLPHSPFLSPPSSRTLLHGCAEDVSSSSSSSSVSPVADGEHKQACRATTFGGVGGSSTTVLAGKALC